MSAHSPRSSPSPAPCPGSRGPPATAATVARLDAEAGATPLARCGRWRGPLGFPRITGSASLSRSRSIFRASSSYLHRAVIVLLISYWARLSAAAVASASISVSASFSLDGPPHPYPTLILPNPDTDKDAAAEAPLLLVDTRIPVFVDGHWQIMSDEEHRELRRREPAPKESQQAATTTTEVVIDVSTVTDSTGSPTTTTAASSPLPSPFDGALAANFSAGQSCPNFINAFLSNETFKACYPISLLLQGSQSFFEAEKSPFSITQVLDAACKADLPMCADYFHNLADALIADANCGKEYDRENALVVQAYRGMKTYDTVYRATCLTDVDNRSSPYCFASAVTNRTTTSNAYLYYLPFNSNLPVDIYPACGSCTQQTMGIYQAATSNRKAEIANTYPRAAEQINSMCGNNFVNTSLAAVVDSGTTTSLYPTSSSSLLLLSFLSVAISHWIL